MPRTSKVAAPLHAPPSTGLLASAEIVPPEVEGETPRWMAGIEYAPEACGPTGGALALGCRTDQHDLAEIDDSEAQPDHVASHPFIVWAGNACSTFGWEAQDYVGRARRSLEQSEQYLVESEFFSGAAAADGVTAGVDYPDGSGPYAHQWLQDSASDAVTVLTAADTPAELLGRASEQFGACLAGSQGMIHVPKMVFHRLVAAQLLRREGNRFFTADNHIVVPGDGYANESPAGVGVTGDAGWAYLTSLVRIFRGPTKIMPGSYAEALGRTNGVPNNTVQFRAMRPYLVDWDRCCHAAINLTASP